MYAWNHSGSTWAATFRGALCLILLPIVFRQAQADQQVAIITDENAHRWELMAARELEFQWKRLFQDIDTTHAQRPVNEDQFLVLIGSPHTNPQVDRVLGEQWPDISDQGLVIKTFSSGDQSGIVVGGGSPLATLWAVYELGHRLGIRYLLHNDVYPERQVPLALEDMAITMEPQLRTRSWRTINDFAIGPESWGLADHQRMLRQLAKLKFNHLILSLWPWQPFVHYEIGNVQKETATFWFDEQYRVDGDTPGKKVFGGATFFENPDFAGIRDYDQLLEAGVRHVRGIIDAAHDLGMEVGIAFYPLEFPKEFQAALPGSRIAHQLSNLTITPAGEQHLYDPTLKALTAAKVRAYLETYPKIDALYFRMSEFPEWNQHASEAWDSLMSASPGKRVSLPDLIQAARRRKTIATGNRGENSLKGNVVSLAFLKNLLKEKGLLRRDDGQNVDVVLVGIDTALYPFLPSVIPSGASTLHFVDYTARRVVQNQELLSTIPTKQVKSRLIVTLADDNVGVLPQTALKSAGSLMDHLRAEHWDGFSTRYWMPSELDPVVHYLSRAAWDRQVTPRSAHDDFWQAVTEHPLTAERLWIGWEHLEAATEIIDREEIGFGFPTSGMLMKHYKSKSEPEWWEEITDHYTQLRNELSRAKNASTSPGGRSLLFHYANRAAFATQYMAAVNSVRQAAVAREEGKLEEAIEHLESALEQMYNGMTSLADVARDQSDRGLIAVLNAYAYQPLKAEYERLLDEDESGS